VKEKVIMEVSCSIKTLQIHPFYTLPILGGLCRQYCKHNYSKGCQVQKIEKAKSSKMKKKPSKGQISFKIFLK